MFRAVFLCVFTALVSWLSIVCFPAVANDHTIPQVHDLRGKSGHIDGNRIEQIDRLGRSTKMVYDVADRLTLKSLVHKASAAANAALLLGLSYTVEASGLRTKIVETRPSTTVGQTFTRTVDYRYDAVKRLTNEDVVHQGTGSNRSSQWLYDAVGNRTLTRATGTLALQAGNFVYDANDRLISESKNGVAITYTHDANGNQLRKTQAGAVVSEFRWDEENRLIGSTLGSGPAQKVISYSYDPNGIRRAQEEVSGGNRKRTEYLVDPNQSYAQVLKEWTASGASSTALPDQTLAKSYVFGDDLISQTIAATTSFYHYDGLGTTRALSNSAGVVTDRYAYSEFGEEDPAGSWNAISTDNTYRYTGEQLDPNLGFYYLRARYMDPSRGGFVGMDSYLGSSQDPQSLHKYLYAHANPVMGTDPSGMFTLAEVGAAMNIQTTLALEQASFGLDFGNRLINGDSDFGVSDGFLLIAGPILGTVANGLFRSAKIVSKFGAKGKVAWATAKKQQSLAEISAASKVAEYFRAGVFLRGSEVKGADAFFEGAKWEIKTTGNNGSTIANHIQESVKNGQAQNFIIDGSTKGMTSDAASSALRTLENKGIRYKEIIFIMNDGTFWRVP